MAESIVTASGEKLDNIPKSVYHRQIHQLSNINTPTSTTFVQEI